MGAWEELLKALDAPAPKNQKPFDAKEAERKEYEQSKWLLASKKLGSAKRQKRGARKYAKPSI